MKKRYIWGGAALWVLGSGLIILHMAQGDVEGKIRQWMAVHSCTAEEVDFSLLSDELSIRGITLEYEKDGRKLTGQVDSVLLSGVHRAAFDADNGDLTPLADTFSVEGLSFESLANGEKWEGRIQRLYGKGWYENLATSAQAVLKDKSLRTMLEGLRRYRVDELVYEGYEARGTVSIPLVDGTVRTLAAVSRVERVSLPEGIGFRPGEEKGELRVSMVGEGVITELEGWMNTRTARIELRDVYIPDTDTLLTLQQMPEWMNKHKPSEEEWNKYLTGLLAAWEGHLPFGAIQLKELECEYGPESGGLPGWSVEELACTLDEGARMEAGVSVKGIRSRGLDDRFEQEARVPARLREKFLPNGLILDAAVQLSLAGLPAEKAAGEAELEPDTVEFMLGIRGLGRMNSVFEMITEENSGSQSFSKLKDTLLTSMVSGANLEYRDEGFLPFIFSLGTASSGQSVTELKKEVMETAGVVQQEMGIVGLAKSVRIMLDRPGVLKVSCMPEEPVPLAALGFLAWGAPDGLEFAVKATPGEKTLEELLK